MLNRNKEGVTLDTGTEKGRQGLLELLKDADIFIEDWGPGKAEELGLGYETLERLNPKLVYCAISPFGEKGPFKQRLGSELVVQMMAEQWASLGDIGEPPLRLGADMGNVSTALMALLGILAALFHRVRSGTGQRVAVSMLGTLLTMRQVVWSAIGSPDEWEGAFTNPYTQPRHHGLQIGDRRYYVRQDTKTNIPEFLADMDRRYGLPHDIASMEAKLRHLSLEDILGDAFFREEPFEQVAELLSKHDFTVIPINDLRAALEHPQTATLDLFDILEQPTLGAVNVLRPPWKGPWKRPALSPAPMP
jgi:crotonobetainyl-CoA:carnitine CoA-transferase CaiB-like acyl-CoA transferase